jgi:hypothetical protein
MKEIQNLLTFLLVLTLVILLGLMFDTWYWFKYKMK